MPCPRIHLHTTVLTGSGCPGCPGAAMKLGRLTGTRVRLKSWVPIRAASEEASSEMALEKKCVPCDTGFSSCLKRKPILYSRRCQVGVERLMGYCSCTEAERRNVL